MSADAEPLLTLPEAVVVSATHAGSDAALVALAYVLAQRLDSCADPFAAQQLSARLLDTLRELGWTPHTRAGDDDDEYRAHAELGSATLRNIAEREPRALRQ